MAICYYPPDIFPPDNDLNIIRKGNILNNEKYIKITKRWLIKLGFNQGKGKYDKGVFRLGHYQLFWCKEEGFCYTPPFPSWQFASVSWSCNASIQYVHQLQNIYFYSEGKELILNEVLLR